jgi:eukaryotic-like serine/threonine-protein kinase
VIEVGTTVGNYQVVQKIGSGAMGAVFLASHPVIGKRVALKVIHPELAGNEEMVARFFNEARAVTQIGHENIVDVQDFGQTPDGDSFIVMELLEGVGLGAQIKAEGMFSIPRATHIGIQMADGLSAAHARGIIHRDLKPDNVMLISRGGDGDFVKILDFGLAKLSGPGAMQNKTKTGSLLGTPHYMAPEQAEGKKAVDHRADVYALGCILFQMVTGRVPFPGDGFGEVLVKHLREPPPLPTRLNPQVPKHLEKIILHALAKKPEFRFASMEDFRAALRDPERFSMRMDHAALEAHLTPDKPLPAINVPPIASGPPPAATIVPPTGAPQRLDSDAPTVMGEQPAQVQAALAQRDAQRQQQQQQRPAGAFDVATAPGAQRQSKQTIAQGKRLPAPGRRGAGRSTAILIGVFAGLIGLSAIGAVIWYFVGHPGSKHISVAVTSTPPGAEVVQGDRILGNAPVVVALPRGDQAITLAMRKEGFLTAQRTLTPNTDQEITVRLLPKPVEDTPPPEPAAPEPPPQAKSPPPAKAAPPEPAPVEKAETPAPKPHTTTRRKKKPAVEPLLLTPTF